MKKYLQLLLAVFCWIVLSSYNTQAFAQVDNSTLAEVTPSAQYQFFYMLNAASGTIVKQTDGSMQLILQGVHPVVKHYTRGPHKNNGTISINKLIDVWVQYDKNGSHRTLAADLTGIQVNNKSNTTKQFLQKVVLSKPYFVKQKSEFVANLGFANSGITISPTEKLDNVTLVIDGCQLCDCDDNQVECDF